MWHCLEVVALEPGVGRLLREAGQCRTPWRVLSKGGVARGRGKMQARRHVRAGVGEIGHLRCSG